MAAGSRAVATDSLAVAADIWAVAAGSWAVAAGSWAAIFNITPRRALDLGFRVLMFYIEQQGWRPYLEPYTGFVLNAMAHAGLMAESHNTTLRPRVYINASL